jgi:hypothetical protein
LSSLPEKEENGTEALASSALSICFSGVECVNFYLCIEQAVNPEAEEAEEAEYRKVGY